MTEPPGSVGILWRGDREARGKPLAESNRLRPVFDALADANIAAEPVVFDDDVVDEVRDQLAHLDGVLVWVDPIMRDRDRTVLDALLRDVSARGTWVSAHPDTIMAMGTKEVLYRTRELGWGADTHLYRTLEEFRREFPSRVASGPRVLKQHRGNGGIGVWKVELASAEDGGVLVQHAAPRDTAVEKMAFGAFVERCSDYFAAGPVVDQPFQPRISDGMVRCYMVRDEVAGFAHQYPDEAAIREGKVLGLPAAKTMFPESEPRFARLRERMEQEWLPGLRRLLAVDTGALPLLWDADFLYGPKTPAGADTYLLCEINCSSVLPFPQQVPAKLAQAVAARLVSSVN